MIVSYSGIMKWIQMAPFSNMVVISANTNPMRYFIFISMKHFMGVTFPIQMHSIAAAIKKRTCHHDRFFLQNPIYSFRVFGFYGGKGLINHPSPNS